MLYILLGYQLVFGLSVRELCYATMETRVIVEGIMLRLYRYTVDERIVIFRAQFPIMPSSGNERVRNLG